MSHMKAENKSSIEASKEAIAKVNAILIAKGKLKPSQLNAGTGRKTSGSMNNLITAEVEINDVPIGCRNLLTRGTNQEEISKMSGAAVATRGRYMTAEDRIRNPHERALYLSIQASSQEDVDLACGRIREIIANGFSRQTPKPTRFSPVGGVIRGGNPPRGPPQPSYHSVPPPQAQPQPQPLMQVQTQNIPIFQEKLFIGLEHAPPNFSVKDKVLGPGASFLQHVQIETGAKVSLRGKGSGFIEMNGQEAMEPMHLHLQHVNMMGLQQAKELSTNLIQTVQQEYAAFQQSFVTVPPPNVIPQQTYMMPPPPQLVSLAQPPPLLPGQQLVSVPVSSMAPAAPPMLQAPPQTAFIQSQPAPGTLAPGPPNPGVVLPQMSTMSPIMSSQPPPVPGPMLQPPGQPMQQFAPPASNMGPPPGMQHVVPASEQQVLGQPVSSQILVSGSPSQPNGQTVVYTVGGQSMPAPHTLQVSQVPQQMGPPGSVQMPQPPMNLPQQTGIQQQLLPQQILQPAGNQQFGHQPQQHQAGIQLQQQPNMMQPPVSSQPQYVQQLGQPTYQLTSSIPQVQQQQQPQPFIQQHQQAPVSMAQQQLPPLGSQMVPNMMPPTISWSGTQPNYTTAPTIMSVQGQQQVGFQQPPLLQNTTTTMIANSPQSVAPVVMTTSTPTLVTSAPSQYVYHTGPREEPKRRFTETKPEDQVPENLLGYEHGPPHLANLVVQPSQQHQHQSPHHQQHQHPHQQQQQLHPPPGTSPAPASDPGSLSQQPQQGYSSNQLVPQAMVGAGQPGTIAQSQVHVQQLQQQYHQQFQSHEQTRSEGDIPKTPGLSPSPGPQLGYNPTPNGNQHLMPPPPPPGMKREGDASTAGPEQRKKAKGQSTDEEEDLDIPSSMANQAKELKKYSFNQYSNSPQLYTKPETSPGDQHNNNGFLQQSYQEPGTMQSGHNVQGTIVYDHYGNPIQQQPGSHPAPTESQAGREPGVQSEAEPPNSQYQSGNYYPDQQNKGQPFYSGASSASATSPQVQPNTGTSSYQLYQSAPPLASHGFGTPEVNNPPAPFSSQPPPPPPLMEETAAPTARDEGPTPRRQGPVFVHFGRRDDNRPPPFQQPPPPPPPPRSYW